MPAMSTGVTDWCPEPSQRMTVSVTASEDGNRRSASANRCRWPSPSTIWSSMVVVLTVRSMVPGAPRAKPTTAPSPGLLTPLPAPRWFVAIERTCAETAGCRLPRSQSGPGDAEPLCAACTVAALEKKPTVRLPSALVPRATTNRVPAAGPA